jgi:hypothetical protein
MPAHSRRDFEVIEFACVFDSSAAGCSPNRAFLLAPQQRFPDSKKCREIGTFVGEAS